MSRVSCMCSGCICLVLLQIWCEQPVAVAAAAPAKAFKHYSAQFPFSSVFVIVKFSCKTSSKLCVAQIVFILYSSLQFSVSGVELVVRLLLRPQSTLYIRINKFVSQFVRKVFCEGMPLPQDSAFLRDDAFKNGMTHDGIDRFFHHHRRPQNPYQSEYANYYQATSPIQPIQTYGM